MSGPPELSALIVALVGLLGAGLGAVGPLVIAALPDRAIDDGRRSYRELASMRGLPLILGTTTALLWVALTLSRWPELDLPAYLWLAWIGVLAAYVDLREHRLPDVLTAAAILGVALFLGLAAAIDDRWAGYGQAWLAALAAAAVFLALALARSSGMGLGDVKLVAPLGLALGWLSWNSVLIGLFLGFVLAAVVAVYLVLARRADRDTALPFGPALLLGTILAVVLVSA